MIFSRMLARCQPHVAVGVRQFAADQASATAGHTGGMKLWKKLSFLVAMPAVLVCMINAYIKESEHIAHFERPEFRPYEHVRIRTKKFPWGDGNHSLFHNPKYNALPEGYEDIGDEGHGGHH